MHRIKQTQLAINKTVTLDQAVEKEREEARKKAVVAAVAKAQEKENTMD